MASVDVVIPNYQYGRYLRDCVDSVLSQDVEDLRVLIIDNASTDNSVEVATELARRDPRVEVMARRVNLGPHASYNAGIDWARADYFLILCSDDLLAPGCLRRAAAIMDRHPSVCMTYGRDLPVGEDDPPPALDPGPPEGAWRILSGQAFIERFCRSGVFDIPGSTLVVRTETQKRVGYYRPELPHSDDYDVWLRLACLGDVAETDAIQAVLRHHGASRSAFIRQAHNFHIDHTLAAVECFFAHEGGRLAAAGRLHRLARRSLAGRAYWSAVSNMARGHGELGLELLRLAVRLQPMAALVPPVGYLFRRPGSFGRIGGVVREAAQRLVLPGQLSRIPGETGKL